MVVLAQLVSAPDCGSGGHRFDSDIPPHRRVGTEHPCGASCRRVFHIYLFCLIARIPCIGVSPSGKATDFDSVITLVRSQPPQPAQGLLPEDYFLLRRRQAAYDPLAQLAEHLTFNQGVRSSNLRWVTRTALSYSRKGLICLFFLWYIYIISCRLTRII